MENLLVKVEDLWKCKVCGKTSTSGRRRNLRDHAEIHVQGLRYQCQKCDKICPNKISLRNHLFSKHSKRDKSCVPDIHPPSNTRELVDDMEEGKSETVTGVGQVMEGELIPIDLNREISEKINDLIEKKSHNEWKCRKCWRSSTRKCQLVNHLETHLNYTHHCPRCDFTARTRRGLKDHYKVTHKK